MQQEIKKLQWFESFEVVFLQILNMQLCRVFANRKYQFVQTKCPYNKIYIIMKTNYVCQCQVSIMSEQH